MQRVINKSFGILLFLVFFISCNIYGDKSLGGNYYFLEDGNQSEKVFGGKGGQGGFTIIDANVTQYNSNDRYIIAKSIWLKKNGNETYWIIDKGVKIERDTSKKGDFYERHLKKGLLGPLTKDSFDFLLLKYGIHLNLKN